MLTLFLALKLSAPVPTPTNWLKVDDYPMQYVKAGRTFDVDLRTTVRANGTAQECSIEKSSGEPEFDKYNCGLLLRRLKFKPATDAAGKPVVGVFRNRVAWTLDNRKMKPRTGDIEVTVAKLPAGLKFPTLIDVAVSVDSAGKPSDCSSGKPDQNAALLKIACAQLVQTYRATPARLTGGEAVPSVQNAIVSFVNR